MMNLSAHLLHQKQTILLCAVCCAALAVLCTSFVSTKISAISAITNVYGYWEKIFRWFKKARVKIFCCLYIQENIFYWSFNTKSVFTITIALLEYFEKPSIFCLYNEYIDIYILVLHRTWRSVLLTNIS